MRRRRRHPTKLAASISRLLSRQNRPKRTAQGFGVVLTLRPAQAKQRDTTIVAIMIASLPLKFVRRVAAVSLAAVLVLAASRTSAADLSGCWEGCWRSCTTGHHGKLRATITKIDETSYCARFSGTFFRIIPFRYTTVLSAEEEGVMVKLSGASYLGRLMGTFYYDGTATDCAFDMNYSSCKDCGVFKMQRASSCSCCR